MCSALVPASSSRRASFVMLVAAVAVATAVAVAVVVVAVALLLWLLHPMSVVVDVAVVAVVARLSRSCGAAAVALWRR